MKVKAGDTQPSLVIEVTDAGGVVDLTTAEVVRVVGRQGIDLVIDDATPALERSAGKVTHTWVDGETDRVGRIWLEVAVTWANGSKQTFPTLGQLAVDVDDDNDA